MKNAETNALGKLFTLAAKQRVCLVVAVDEIGRNSDVDFAHALCSHGAPGELRRFLLQHLTSDIKELPNFSVVLAIAGTGLGDGTISPGSESSYYHIVHPSSEKVFEHLQRDVLQYVV
eukprot:PhM_4_TR3055/c0_g1_i1/m.97863